MLDIKLPLAFFANEYHIADMDMMIIKYLENPEIQYFAVGQGDDWCEGPSTKAGYYIMPFCDVGCCPPDGPFEDIASAREDALSRALDYQIKYKA